MSSKDSMFQLFDDIDDREVTADNSANPVSSNGGLALPVAIERRFGIVKGLSELWRDTRDPLKVVHSVFDILFFRILAIVAGYEDCNDLNTLRKDSIFKAALRVLPSSLKKLACQATMSRMENSLKERDVENLLNYNIEIYCTHGYSTPPNTILLDIDETICKTYGDQQGSFYNGFDRAKGFRPLHINDIKRGCVVVVKMRPARTLSDKEVQALVIPVLKKIREFWPRTKIKIRGDSHYARPNFFSWCEDQKGIDYITGLATNSRLKAEPCVEKAVADCERLCAKSNKEKETITTICEFKYAAQSWKGKERRVIAVVRSTKKDGEVHSKVRYIVTSIKKHTARYLYRRVYCKRGQAENLIKEHKNYLKSDRMSCTSFRANQVRQVFHTAAHWFFVFLRDHIPGESYLKKSAIPVLQLKLLKVATVCYETSRRVHFAFSNSFPDYELLKKILERIRGSPPLVRQTI